MREILFRAKRIDNGEWVEGYYGIKGKGTDIENHYIMVPTFQSSIGNYDYMCYFTDVHIDPETICQYTGLKDKNGNRIWENDIARIDNSMDEGVGNIEFYGGMWYVDGEPSNRLYDIVEYDDAAEVEVIGNIFDNPELLKGE